MPSFSFLFHLMEKLLTFDLFWGYFGPKWTTRRHMGAPILEIGNFRLHNRILHPKISLNAKFQLFIPFNREVINVWLIWGYFLLKWTTRRHRCASIVKIWNFRLHNPILHPKISLNAGFQLHIPFNREVIKIWQMLVVIWA